jgi:geranylgeranyl pyrophosphate synthase
MVRPLSDFSEAFYDASLRVPYYPLYKRIVKFKTAFYTFYLPMAAGLILGGTRDAATLKAVEAVCMEIGEKFQIQDDYLDNYGDPAFVGNIGTDIQDFVFSLSLSTLYWA